LVLTHSTPDDVADDVTEAMKDVYSNASARVAPRTYQEVGKFFDGLELIEPGLVNVTQWRRAAGARQQPGPPARSLIYGGVARKEP
ncbi:MAG: SAM-dependent methyltransferase, partial [Trebonia sp.]